MLDFIRQEIEKALRRHWAGMSLLAQVIEPQQEWKAKVRFLASPLPVMDARVAQPAWAVGAQAIAPLKKGDEVLVVFPDGDMAALPVVTHRVFNGMDKPPTAVADEWVLELTDPEGALQVRFKKTAAGTLQVTVQTGNVEITCAQGNATVTCTQGNIQATCSNGDATITAKNAKVLASVEALVDAPSILLGTGATQPVPLGNALKSWLDGHVHPDPQGGNTGPPTAPSPDPSTVVKVKP